MKFALKMASYQQAPISAKRISKRKDWNACWKSLVTSLFFLKDHIAGGGGRCYCSYYLAKKMSTPGPKSKTILSHDSS